MLLNPSHLTLTIVCLLIASCSNSTQESPLQSNLSFTYSEELTYKGKTLTSETQLNFTKQSDKRFKNITVITDQFGSRDQDPVYVDGFFKREDSLPTTIASYPIWRAPKRLASGRIGDKKVTEGQYRGKRVYTLVRTEGEEAHYNKTDGFLEGAKKVFEDTKRIVRRLK